MYIFGAVACVAEKVLVNKVRNNNSPIIQICAIAAFLHSDVEPINQGHIRIENVSVVNLVTVIVGNMKVICHYNNIKNSVALVR
jgi:hypothetical protein